MEVREQNPRGRKGSSLKDDMERTKNKERNIDHINYLAVDSVTHKKGGKSLPS